MKDDETRIAQLKEIAGKYCSERGWDRYQTPKEIAIGIITEASELLEQFRFKSEAEMLEMLKEAKKREAIEDELADVLYFMLLFAKHYKIDLADAYDKKIKKNQKKYPIEKTLGRDYKKYNEL